MPVEQVPQPCEVCGVETTQRCSSCLEAGIDLFFCGKDHQKLVWPAHKTVCGPGKAHPFVVTPLSLDELAWAKGQLGTAVTVSGQTMRQELAKMSQREQPAESLLDELTGDTYFGSKMLRKNLIVQWVRAKYGTRKHGGVNSPASMDMERVFAGETNRFALYLTAQPSATLMRQIYAKLLAAQRIGLEVDESTWFSLVQHKALITSHLLQISVVRGQEPTLKSYWEPSVDRMHAWIRAGAGSDDSRIKRALASFRDAGEEDEDT